MKITIKEIAKLAGVSPGTVSKVLNNYHDVGEETKKKSARNYGADWVCRCSHSKRYCS